MSFPPRSRNDFSIAVLCALSSEADKVLLLLDHNWETEARRFGRAPNDNNSYTFGSISQHNVVIVHIGRIGSHTASAAASDLRHSFTQLRLVFVVGVCGIGPVHEGEEIVLGDCIVGTSLVQYDFGSQYDDLYRRKDSIEDGVGSSSPVVSNFVAKVRAESNQILIQNKIFSLMDDIRQKSPAAGYPGAEHDRLFHAEETHRHPDDSLCPYCLTDVRVCKLPCELLGCNPEKVIRVQTIPRRPRLHFGRIESANTVMKSGRYRDMIHKKDDVIAFEMEGCGVWSLLPTIILKAACDYADSHKNKVWQPYAASVAACALKTLLAMLDADDHAPTTSLLPSFEQTITFRNEHINVRLEEFRNNLPDIRINGLVRRLKEQQDLLRPGHEYWSHMTLEGYKVYESICCILEAAVGRANILGFAQFFGHHLPHQSELVAKWKRLDPTLNQGLSRSYTMALMYMLHMECFEVTYASKRPSMTVDVLRILQSFHVWASCPCRRSCQVKWNFVNSNSGMCQGPGNQCLLFARFKEREKFRLEPEGSIIRATRSKSDRQASEELRRRCFADWLRLGLT